MLVGDCRIHCSRRDFEEHSDTLYALALSLVGLINRRGVYAGLRKQWLAEVASRVQDDCLATLERIPPLSTAASGVVNPFVKGRLDHLLESILPPDQIQERFVASFI